MRPIKLAIIGAVIVLSTVFYILFHSGNEKVVYSEGDVINYFMLTDKEIANVPRVSEKFYFISYPGDGYAPSDEIVFEETNETETIEDYLTSLGYVRMHKKTGGNEVWSKPDDEGESKFYLYVDKKENKVSLTKIFGGGGSP